MMLTTTPLTGFGDHGPILFTSPVYPDERGWFMETFRTSELREALAMHGVTELVQGNAALSKQYVLRGLHYGIVKPQGKLMKTLRGTTLNIVVDMRDGSPTLGHADWVCLSESQTKSTSLYVPPGFGNGYISLRENTIVVYHCTTEYSAGGDRAVRWNSVDLPWDDVFDSYGIDVNDLIISDKDRNAALFNDAEKVIEE